MPRRPRLALLIGSALAAVTLASTTAAADAPFQTDLDDGARGWRVVLDGVMGGLSSGRMSTPEDGVLRFTGRLRLENNGGFSQIRRAVNGGFEGANGIALRVRGDGRTYQFNLRASNARMMAGGYETTFDTVAGEWIEVRIPFSDFELTSFGRRVRGPELDPSRIESIGITLADKTPGEFRLDIDEIRADVDRPGAAPGAMNGGSAASGDDLASVAQGAGLTTLLELVAATGIAEALPKDEPITVLAPTNDAFGALPEETLRTLLAPENRDALRRVLAHHVIPGRATARDLFDRRGVDSLAGQTVTIEPGAGLVVGGARVIAADVPFDGGVVHVIDSVIVPELRTIAAVAAETPDLSTLVAAIRAAGVERLLGPANDGPWTVFAPVDSAFAALPEGTVESLLTRERLPQLRSVLGFHVVPGRVRLADLTAETSLRTLEGLPLTARFGGDGFEVGGANILAADIDTANGVVHLIDRVLIPSSDETPSETMSSQVANATAPFPAAMRLIEDAVSIGAPLFNDGNEAACAATYLMAVEALGRLTPERFNADERRVIRAGIAAARAEADPVERSWILRRALDSVYQSLDRRD